MTIDRDQDIDATLKMPRPMPKLDQDIEDVDPEKTLVRDDWESTAIRRVAPRIAAVQSAIAEDARADGQFGWESESLRRLAQELQRAGK